MMYSWAIWWGEALAAAAAAYAITAAIASCVRLKPDHVAYPNHLPAVTLLKPLCGAEHDLYGGLRSFFEQDYPKFQIVFGVAAGDDAAVEVVTRLQREFPGVDTNLVIDRRQHGSSRKVSNLVNMLPVARHDCLVISDSDIRVTRDYLAKIVPPLLDPGVGIVTCAYRGIPQRGLWSLLGSMLINEWFIPSVRVAALSGSRAFAFGVTIAVHRRVLARVGGLAAIADQLADDYRLGELTRARGLRTILSGVVVDTCVDEKSLSALVRHELRWLRTIRAVRPIGYALMCLTFTMPVAVIGCALSAGATPAVIFLLIAAVGRLVLHLRTRDPTSALARDLWAVPLRDSLSLLLWCWGFMIRRVYWRDAPFRITRDGTLHPVSRIPQ